MKFRVLLIDDEPSAIEGLLLWIDWQAVGFEICGTSSNGREGLQQMEQLMPDLVITDVNMPLMNGLEMIAAWQQESRREIKFAILSGYSEFEYAQSAIRYGINHYLLKPLIAEEAEQELQEIHRELEEAARRQNLHQIASSEEVVALIKGFLNEKPEDKADKAEQAVLARLENGGREWNLCLIQTAPGLYAELRGRIAGLIAEQTWMFLMDMEPNSCGVVYASSPGFTNAGGIHSILAKLQHEYARQPIYMAVGASAASLSNIANSYRTAKEALLHFFYHPEFTGVLFYQEIENTPFSYHYDQIQQMDALLRSIHTLDKTEFYQAVDSAARSFRERLVAPEIVKKTVIHIMYTIIEFTREAGGAEASSLLTEFRVADILDSMLSLTDLLNHLKACGEGSVDILLNQQYRQSRGIVEEINAYIEEHYREALTIKKLAEIFFLHPVYLGQLLNKKNGFNFNEQLHNLRIKEATRLLLQSKLKNSEIAEQVGYSNYGQFLKQFEKKLQMSPTEYKHTNT